MSNGTITMTGAEYDALAGKIAALEAELAKLRAELERRAVDGWKLVPVEPTPEMVSAAEEAHMPFGDMDIALRMAMLAAPAAPEADAGIVDMYRHLQKVTPYRFKKIQDASITDGGDVMYFHKDRFDAALLADMAAHCAAKGVV